MATLVKASISQAIGQALIDDVFLQKSVYYYGLGRAHAWTVENVPDQTVDTEKYEQGARTDLLYLKRIEGSSISFVIPRIDYTPNTIYSIYDDEISLDGSNFYVMNSNFNVYKCLSNNGGSPSFNEPFGTSQSVLNLSDGYSWKFIYNIPPALRNKFLTTLSMPVYNAITERYYSRGSINSVIINNAGTGYDPIDTQIAVEGDGFLEFDPQKIQQFFLTDGGSGYSTIPMVETIDQYLSTPYFPNTQVVLGQYLKVTDVSGTRIYSVETEGVTGASTPTHYYSAISSGTAVLRHVGTKPKITATIIDDVVVKAVVLESGFGYQTTPTITKDSPGTGAVLTASMSGGALGSIIVSSGGSGYVNGNITIASPYPSAIPFTTNTAYNLNDILSYFDGLDTYFYQVDQAGTTGNNPPTHTSGSDVNGTTILTVVAKQARGVAVLGYVDAIQGYQDVASISILNSGTGYDENTTVEFINGSPDISATAVAIVSNGEVVRIDVTYPGYGYLTTPTIQINGVGTGASATAVMQFGYGYPKTPNLIFSSPDDPLGDTAFGITSTTKTNAKIAPDIVDGKIRGIRIIDGGVGYTTARLTVLGTGTGGELTPVFASGDLNSIQANNELFAVPGTISGVKVLSGGSGITSISATISGDGTGASIEPVVVNGSLQQIRVLDAGENYSTAEIDIEVNAGAVMPTVRVIISPIKGHGSNPLQELYAKSVALYAAFSQEFLNGFSLTNEFRQISILKNPLKFGASSLLFDRVASACFLITSNLTTIPLENDMVLSLPNGNQFRVIEFNNLSAVLQPLGNFTVNVNDVLSIDINSITYNIPVGGVSNPKVDKYSGELLYIDNVTKFTPTENQTIALNTVINLL